MTVTLGRSYVGLPAGTVVSLPAETEAALIAQNLATNGGTLTAGAQTRAETAIFAIPMFALTAVIAAGASTVVVSDAAITANSKAFAIVAQAAADGTLTQIVRASCAAGAVTITGNAAATANTVVSILISN